MVCQRSGEAYPRLCGWRLRPGVAGARPGVPISRPHGTGSPPVVPQVCPTALDKGGLPGEHTTMKNFIFALVLALSATAVAAQTPVTLKSSDGITLKATYYPAAKPGPGIVLLHQCNQDRRAWSAFASRAAGRGYHVITMDYRGFGESEGPRNPDAAEQQSTVAQKWPGDVDAAFTWLQAQPGVDKNRIGAAGASCGVNQAVLLSSRHPEVKSLALLSGGVTPAARSHVQKSPTL